SYASDHHRALHSLPTRRSSDLEHLAAPARRARGTERRQRRAAGTRLHADESAFSGRLAQPAPRLRLPVPSLAARERGFICVKSRDRKSTRLNSSHLGISYAVFC